MNGQGPSTQRTRLDRDTLARIGERVNKCVTRVVASSQTFAPMPSCSHFPVLLGGCSQRVLPPVSDSASRVVHVPCPGVLHLLQAFPPLD